MKGIQILQLPNKDISKMFRTMGSLLTVMMSSVAIGQSPWVNKKGSFYGQVSGTRLSYTSIINDSYSNIIGSGTSTTDITLGLFGDYSLFDKMSVSLDAPLKSVLSGGERLVGLGDPRVRFKHQLLQKVPLAVYYGYTAPLSRREGALRTGYKQHAFELGTSVGVGLKNLYAYGSLSYRFRNNIPNQLLLQAEVGYRFSVFKRDFYIMLNLDGALSEAAGDVMADQSVLYHNGGEYLSPGVKFAYNVWNKFWVNASFFGAVRARKMGAAPTSNFGIAYSLKR